jgi:glycosyltransferase involved in cell wall biosynthesis
LRISVVPGSAEETALGRAERFLTGARPEAVAAALRRCDLMLFPARPGEGFGLPLLEALACGVPAVASRLPSTEVMTREAVPLVPWDAPAAFAAAAAGLLSEPWRWRQARRDGRAAARRFRPAKVANLLQEAVDWATSGRGN